VKVNKKLKRTLGRAKMHCYLDILFKSSLKQNNEWPKLHGTQNRNAANADDDDADADAAAAAESEKNSHTYCK